MFASSGPTCRKKTLTVYSSAWPPTDKNSLLKNAVKALVKSGDLEKSGERDALEKRRAKVFDERQRKILTDGVSNAEYHYLGSAKILGGIGKGFAEALAELHRSK